MVDCTSLQRSKIKVKQVGSWQLAKVKVRNSMGLKDGPNTVVLFLVQLNGMCRPKLETAVACQCCPIAFVCASNINKTLSHLSKTHL